MSERKHSLVKIRASDYLLLSNDGRTLWRIYRYDDRWPNEDMWWATARYDGTPEQAIEDDELEHAWDRWITAEWYVTTRREAIEKVLEAA